MTQQQDSPTNGRGRTVVLAAVSINLILGVLYAWSMLGKALVGQWHWTKAEAARPFSVSAAAFAITMIFAGRLQDKIGPRFVAMAGGIILGLGLVLSSFAHTPMAMAIAFGLVGGIGIGVGYSATTPPCIKWFPPNRKGLITGLVVSGVGLAAVYISPLTQYLLSITSISNTFLILGLGAIVLVAILAQFLVNPPAGYVASLPSPAAGAAAKAPAAAQRNLDWREMLATPQFYLLWLLFVMAASGGLMIIAHMATIAKEQAGLAWGFVPVATLALFNTSGRVVSGFLSDKIGRSPTMVLALVLQALNMFLFSHYTSQPLLIAGSALTGLCYGTFFTLMPATTADFYGVKNLGVNYGLLFTGFGVAGVFGPQLGGLINDHFKSFNYSFTISGIMLLVGAVLALSLRAPKVQAAPAPSSQAKPEQPAATR